MIRDFRGGAVCQPRMNIFPARVFGVCHPDFSSDSFVNIQSQNVDIFSLQIHKGLFWSVIIIRARALKRSGDREGILISSGGPQHIMILPVYHM